MKRAPRCRPILRRQASLGVVGAIVLFVDPLPLAINVIIIIIIIIIYLYVSRFFPARVRLWSRPFISLSVSLSSPFSRQRCPQMLHLLLGIVRNRKNARTRALSRGRGSATLERRAAVTPRHNTTSQISDYLQSRYFYRTLITRILYDREREITQGKIENSSQLDREKTRRGDDGNECKEIKRE